jgi:hypothetical protein
VAFAPIGQGFDRSTSTRGTIGSRRKGGLISPVRWPPAVAVLHLRLRYDCRPSADRWSTPVPGGCLGRQGRAGVEGAGAGATARTAPGGSPGTVRPVREPEGSARTSPARHSAPRDARPRANHLAEPVTASSPPAAASLTVRARARARCRHALATTPRPSRLRPPRPSPRPSPRPEQPSARASAHKRTHRAVSPPAGSPGQPLAPPRPTADLTHRQPGPLPGRFTDRAAHTTGQAVSNRHKTHRESGRQTDHRQTDPLPDRSAVGPDDNPPPDGPIHRLGRPSPDELPDRPADRPLAPPETRPTGCPAHRPPAPGETRPAAQPARPPTSPPATEADSPSSVVAVAGTTCG